MGYNDKATHTVAQRTNCALRGKKHNSTAVRAKKKLGQHFLLDHSVARSIADTVDLYAPLPILEVGPGMGMLTQYLMEKGRTMAAVEIDNESVCYLRAHFPTLTVLRCDFLKMDLSPLFNGGPFVLTGNYPYDISSQIFFKMLDYRDQIPCCTGMIQREMALRITSAPGTKAYGILSVLLQAWYNCEYLFTVNEDVFAPQPRVKSAVVRLTRNKTLSLGCDEHLFRRIVKTTFNQRRKMLRVSLRPLFDSNNTPPEAFFLSDDMTRRPEQLSVKDFVALTNLISEILPHNK